MMGGLATVTGFFFTTGIGLACTEDVAANGIGVSSICFGVTFFCIGTGCSTLIVAMMGAFERGSPFRLSKIDLSAYSLI